MKTNPCSIRCLLFCGLFQAVLLSSTAQTVEAGARVIGTKGPARFSLDGATWQPLQVGDIVHSGATLRSGTAPGSSIDLALYHTAAVAPAPVAFKPHIPSSMTTYVAPSRTARNLVRLDQDTTLRLDRLSLEQTGVDLVTDTALTLSEGRIFGAVQKLSPASKYEVRLPKGAVAIRDAQYAISADGTVSVTSGSVDVTYPDAAGVMQTVTVTADQTFNPATLTVVPLSASGRETILASLAAARSVPAPALGFLGVAIDQTVGTQISPVVGLGGPRPGPGPLGPGN